MEKLYYTGIGSRETPAPVLILMTKIATRLQLSGYILRSGGAPGADDAFYAGAVGSRTNGYDDQDCEPITDYAEVYLPWSGFNDYKDEEAKLTSPQPEAFDHAQQFHPAWFNLSYGGKKLMARNSHQILGPDINNPVYSDFVICWAPLTKSGKPKGGTSQVLRIAEHHNIPVFNLVVNAIYDLLAAML